MEYLVVSAESIEDLATRVNSKIREGWSLWEGLVIGRASFGFMFYQTIVKYEKK